MTTQYTIYCLDCEARTEAPDPSSLPNGWGWIVIDGQAYYGCPDHKDKPNYDHNRAGAGEAALWGE